MTDEQDFREPERVRAQSLEDQIRGIIDRGVSPLILPDGQHRSSLARALSFGALYGGGPTTLARLMQEGQPPQEVRVVQPSIGRESRAGDLGRIMGVDYGALEARVMVSGYDFGNESLVTRDENGYVTSIRPRRALQHVQLESVREAMDLLDDEGRAVLMDEYAEREAEPVIAVNDSDTEGWGDVYKVVGEEDLKELIAAAQHCLRDRNIDVRLDVNLDDWEVFEAVTGYNLGRNAFAAFALIAHCTLPTEPDKAVTIPINRANRKLDIE